VRFALGAARRQKNTLAMHASPVSPPPASAASWTAALQERLPSWTRVQWLEQTGSTNPDVQALLRRSAARSDRYLVGAHHQTAGRGRGGKDWATEPGDALLFSCGWATALPLDRLPAFTLVAGLIAAQALDPAPSRRIQVKWPNDLYTEHGKLAGILSETVGLPPLADKPPQRGLVLGIGINARHGARLGTALNRPVGDLERAGLHWDPAEAVARIATAWDAALRRFERQGFVPFLADYLERDWLAGKALRLHTADRVIDGRACGIDESGRLRLHTADGMQVFTLGHVQLAPESA